MHVAHTVIGIVIAFIVIVDNCRLQTERLHLVRSLQSFLTPTIDFESARSKFKQLKECVLKDIECSLSRAITFQSPFTYLVTLASTCTPTVTVTRKSPTPPSPSHPLFLHPITC